MDELTEFQQRACAVGVVKMLNGKHFSITDLDALAKTMGRESAQSGRSVKQEPAEATQQGFALV